MAGVETSRLKVTTMQWQYDQVADKAIDELLDQFEAKGREGWELVAVVFDTPTGNYWGIFKRPLER